MNDRLQACKMQQGRAGEAWYENRERSSMLRGAVPVEGAFEGIAVGGR
jgi:hypothetical protein